MKLKKYEITLLNTDIDKYFNAIKNSMTYLVKNEKMGGVYVALTRPSKAMANRLGADIKLEDVFFVDGVSYMSEGPPAPTENTVYLESPTMLETMIVKIGTMLEKVKSRDKFVFFDSINALSIYNDEKILSEFLHLLVTSLGGKDVVSVLLSVKGQTPQGVENMLKMMCDRVEEVK